MLELAEILCSAVHFLLLRAEALTDRKVLGAVMRFESKVAGLRLAAYQCYRLSSGASRNEPIG